MNVVNREEGMRNYTAGLWNLILVKESEGMRW